MNLMLALTAILLTASLCVSADEIDMSRDGSSSIRVHLMDKTTEGAVGGGTLELLQIAGLSFDGEYAFLPVGEFGRPDFSFDLSGRTDLSDPELAASVSAYADARNITGVTQQVNRYGRAEFTGLPLGVYLVVEREAADGYQTLKPFLVTIPCKDGDTYIYDVDASPKVEGVSPLEPVTEAVPEVVKTIAIPGGKSKASNTSMEYMKISVFEFAFTALDPSYPMPVNSTGSLDQGGNVESKTGTEMILQVEGSGTFEVGKIEFAREGDYYYTVSEIPGDGNYDYDPTKYFLKYSVKREGDKLVVAEKTIHVGSANGPLVSDAVFTFSNRYRKHLRVDEEEEIESHKTILRLIEEENGENKKTVLDVPDETEENPPKKTGSTYEGEEQKIPLRTGSSDVEEETPTPPDRTPTPPDRTPTPNLPQTGQLWWPVWVLAGFGALFLIIGLIRRKIYR